MKVRELMTRDPEFVKADETVSRAARIMRDVDVGIVPVVDDESGRRLRGVITDRDIAVRHVAEAHTEDCPVAEHMSEELAKATPEDEAEHIMDVMRRRRVRRVPIVEDGDRLVGIVAQADVAVKLGESSTERVEETVEEISRPAEPER